MQQEQITVLVHGTFANAPQGPDEPPLPKWWRVDERGLTAERLRAALAAQDGDAADAVWEEGRDPRDGDMTYADLVEWSSANRHKDRLRGAAKLAGSLKEVADRRGCTAENPLHVNYVAHSHGGNVVLESLKHVEAGGNVAPRQVALLGTPLTWRYFDPRIGYLFILFSFFAGWVVADYEYFARERAEDPDALSLPGDILVSILLLVALFWVAFGIIRLLRRYFDGRPGRPAYGPPPEKLRELLGSRPVVLFISDEDEADLMLQLGATPLTTYRALIRGRPALAGHSFGQKVVRLPLRFIEVLFLRPFSYAILVPLLEILLERFGLGFPFRSVMVSNFEMLTWTRMAPYGEVVVKVQIEPDVLEQGQKEAEEALRRITGPVADIPPAPAFDGQPLTERERIDRLRETVLETIKGLKDQVHLSHSGYYQAQRIIDEVAAVIATPDETVEEITIDLNAAHQETPGAPPVRVPPA